MTQFNYEYFSGANAIVTVEGQPILELAGIQFNVNESTIPLWGYNSRYFDAVAPGQVLVQGSFVVNFVHPNYLHTAIRVGRSGVNQLPSHVLTDREQTALTSNPIDGNSSFDFTATDITLQGNTPEEVLQRIDVNDQAKLDQARQALENDYWGPPDVERNKRRYENKDVGLIGPFDLKIHYADYYEYIIRSCFVVGRGQVVEINEQVIVEEYSFFGRTFTTRDVRRRHGDLT